MIDQESKLMLKAIVDHILHEIRNPLTPLEHFVNKMKKGTYLNSKEIELMASSCEKIKVSLNELREMSRNDFENISITSDKQKLIYGVKKNIN